MNQKENSNLNTEEYNKKLLEQAALTISSEGTSKDLKAYLIKKISHNRIVLNNLTQLIDMTLNCSVKKVRDETLAPESPLSVLLSHSVKEVKKTDDMLDLILVNLIEKEFKKEPDKRTYVKKIKR